MDEEPGREQRNEPGEAGPAGERLAWPGTDPPGATREVIEFGGCRTDLPASGSSRLAALTRRLRAAAVELALAALVAGFAAGFIGGRLSAPASHGQPRPGAASKRTRAFEPAVIAFGARCGVQVGKNLELGVEIVNESSAPVVVKRVTPVFYLSGLRAIATGPGPCGALPGSGLPQAPSLRSHASEWVTATLAVLVRCPGPLPVGFEIAYSQAGHTSSTVINAFPDLTPVRYRACPTAQG